MGVVLACGSLAGAAVLRVHDDRHLIRWWKGSRESNVPVLVLVLLVNGRHQRGGRWEHLVDEDEDGFLGRELDALADYVDELAYSEVGGDQVLLLVDGRDVGLLDLLADDGNAVAVLLALRGESA